MSRYARPATSPTRCREALEFLSVDTTTSALLRGNMSEMLLRTGAWADAKDEALHALQKAEEASDGK